MATPEVTSSTKVKQASNLPTTDVEVAKSEVEQAIKAGMTPTEAAEKFARSEDPVLRAMAGVIKSNQ